MTTKTTKIAQRNMRHRRIRHMVNGTAQRPRISVFRSNHHIEVQLINDAKGHTLAAVRDTELKEQKGKQAGKKITRAEELGLLLASKAAKQSITHAVFDRGGYQYHGIVKAVAEGARKGGLTF